MGSSCHQFLFGLLSYCLVASAAVLDARSNGALDGRAQPSCSKPVVKIANFVLSQYPSAASKICSTILHRTAPATVTLTSTEITTTTFALTGSTTETVSFGIKTISEQTTLSETTTVTISSTVATTTATDQSTVTPPTVTVTKTSVTYQPVVRKRAAPTNVGQLLPSAPRPIGAIALALASSACSCFLGPVITPTVTASVTSVETSTVNSVSTNTITVPTSTTFTTETFTSLLTATDVIPLTATIVTTVITTAPTPTSTIVVRPEARFQVVSGPGRGCTYNRYYDFPSVSNDPGPAGDYKPGVGSCQDLCAQNSRCKFFMYIRFDPAEARGFDGGACILDDQLYDPSLLQCQYPTQYYISVNRLS